MSGTTEEGTRHWALHVGRVLRRDYAMYVGAWALSHDVRGAAPTLRDEIAECMGEDVAPLADAFVVAWATKDHKRAAEAASKLLKALGVLGVEE